MDAKKLEKAIEDSYKKGNCDAVAKSLYCKGFTEGIRWYINEPGLANDLLKKVAIFISEKKNINRSKLYQQITEYLSRVGK
jgi:hypothetical protein